MPAYIIAIITYYFSIVRAATRMVLAFVKPSGSTTASTSRWDADLQSTLGPWGPNFPIFDLTLAKPNCRYEMAAAWAKLYICCSSPLSSQEPELGTYRSDRVSSLNLSCPRQKSDYSTLCDQKSRFLAS